MPQLAMYQLDAFTDQVFKGNPAAVIITDDWLSDTLMQDIAIENNLSETAFLKQNAIDNYDIRWFSPITEIDFCGHASLASAAVIFNAQPSLKQITFTTQMVGALTISRNSQQRLEMSFPFRLAVPVNDIPQALSKGLTITPTQVLKSPQAYFAIYENEADIHQLEYDAQQLASLAPFDVVVTAPASTANNSRYDFVSRYFWPANGGDEDPVTGSIHAGLAPYWATVFGKNELVAYQASERGGTLYCTVTPDKVLVSGDVAFYMKSEISV